MNSKNKTKRCATTFDICCCNKVETTQSSVVFKCETEQKKKIIPKNVQLRERNKIENKEREIHRGLGWDVGARAIHAGNGQMVGHHFFFSTVS
jgi:hypothetical protein